MTMFKDVAPDRWSAVDIGKAVRYGLLQGKGNGIFDPAAPLTREQGAALAVRLYEATNEDFKEIIDAVIPAVVQVENDVTGGLGSGTIIHPDGYVLTNAHVVVVPQDDGTYKVPNMVGLRSPDKIFENTEYAMGPVVACDVDMDLAIVKIMLGDATFPYLEIEDKVPSMATRVAAIGSPLGLIRTITEGIVSQYRELNVKVPKRVTVIQTDAAINPGNSGGALVGNMSGKLVGVPSLKLSGVGIEGLGFAIDIPTVKRFFIEHQVPDVIKNLI